LISELEIVCYSEDEKLLTQGRGFILFDITAVEATEAKQLRLNDGAPYLKFGKSSAVSAIATLEITTDF